MSKLDCGQVPSFERDLRLMLCGMVGVATAHEAKVWQRSRPHMGDSEYLVQWRDAVMAFTPQYGAEYLQALFDFAQKLIAPEKQR